MEKILIGHLLMMVSEMMATEVGLKAGGPFLVRYTEQRTPLNIPLNWKALLR
jgi:hypothetical protein